MSVNTEATWLIQRLRKPHSATADGALVDVLNAMAFGGSNGGGLSREALEVLRSVWSFDYMGAAEYERGAVPEALQRMAKAQAPASGQGLLAFEVALSPADIKPGWWRDSRARAARQKELAAAKAAGKRAKRAKKPALDIKPATVFVIAPTLLAAYAEAVVRNCALYKQNLKVGDRLAYVLDPEPEHSSLQQRLGGWLELDHGFLFFTDEAMFKRAKALFGVEREEA
jgi:hypothetical protein